MADVDHFLKITGIPGESQDRTHKDEIEVVSWSWGLTRPATGLGGAARPAFQDISIKKKVDKSSPRLTQACAKGEHFPGCRCVRGAISASYTRDQFAPARPARGSAGPP
jgi:type VI secretion system secreted protein Hcp